MVVGRDQRREARRARFQQEFGRNATVALELIELTELAWHDCYNEPTFSDEILDDLLLVAGGSIQNLVHGAWLAVTDWRDLRVAANELRSP
ncbi:hypothetical protein [Kribbella soli]|uniref:Uncharacterized protein n=1 Tax=Kribbella soli TaxID=1124743 RepID=A0A4R0HCI8_9ACTN|nr:hypothetical protein [Kribbella soli]TCC07658.1 hypothetical protein E0H45_16980 [Kribbella soli]